VKAIHNAVADSANDAQASTRPPETTARELRRMTDDVLGRLRLAGELSVLEVGCGTGILAVPIARRCGRFVGLDFAERALAVLDRRLHDEGLNDISTVVCGDFLSMAEGELDSLGLFDRVLVYSALHYAADDDQAQEFLRRAIGRVRPGGFALFGNLPLGELNEEIVAFKQGTGVTQARSLMRWVWTAQRPLPRSVSWKVRSIPHRAWRKLRQSVRRPAFDPQRLPPQSTVRLRIENLERWLETMPAVSDYQWFAPRVGTPMFMSSADLLVRVG
jgi:2-polyprenyl-3-methyl-5-hydroxy-6-metoxy-1,4-benzoquinol methylase